MHEPMYRAQLAAHPDAIDLPVEQIAARLVRVAELDGELVGFSVLLEPSEGACELDGLFVEPGRMRAGVGRRLMEDATRIARERGAARIDVVAHPQAVAFYRAVGFTTVGTAQTRFCPAPRMSLAVASYARGSRATSTVADALPLAAESFDAAVTSLMLPLGHRRRRRRTSPEGPCSRPGLVRIVARRPRARLFAAMLGSIGLCASKRYLRSMARPSSRSVRAVVSSSPAMRSSSSPVRMARLVPKMANGVCTATSGRALAASFRLEAGLCRCKSCLSDPKLLEHALFHSAVKVARGARQSRVRAPLGGGSLRNASSSARYFGG